MKNWVQAILAVVLIGATSTAAHADTSSRFSANKVHITGFGGVQSSSRFLSVDSVVSFSAARAESDSRNEDIGFPAVLQPRFEEEKTIEPPKSTSGGGGGGRGPFRVQIVPGTRTFGDNGLQVGFSTNRHYAKIFYTTDGSDPRQPGASEIMTGGKITIYEDTTVRAIAKLNDLWSPRDQEFYDYIEPPIIQVEVIAKEIEEVIKLEPRPAPPEIIPEEVKQYTPPVYKGSIRKPEFVLHPGLEIQELHSAPSCPAVVAESRWHKYFSLLWFIAFLIAATAFVNERQCHKKHNHGILWKQQIRKL